ncbi:bifunctional 4-hydroxy-2-oxoglutarate aldolase/2-dehydro-3-deoxy-phosphogluconate aldolase [Rodentibacter caecimuris]|uniref:2-dehydro-3-deoxy-phosphogluconate aldolase n=1 Tax=Rodentibacter caecimuris TaxID=1796644 RepID=A0ABX3KXP0_9PAST|nr:2-dehydro-3-deoxyphosphogluconate aldolase [Rodentibacter heylii]
MNKLDKLVNQLREYKIVPVIALDNAQDILPLAQILSENGLNVAEITFRSQAAEQAINLLRQTLPDFLIAAGTVLTSEQVFQARNASVDWIVTPGFNKKIVKLCQDLDLPITPGVNNPMAIEAALEMGINTVKFFPAEASGGLKMIKALLAPYPQLNIMPTGGITPNNIQDYLTVPNILACGGSWFVDRALIQSQNWTEIRRLTKEIVDLLKS